MHLCSYNQFVTGTPLMFDDDDNDDVGITGTCCPYTPSARASTSRRLLKCFSFVNPTLAFVDVSDLALFNFLTQWTF